MHAEKTVRWGLWIVAVILFALAAWGATAVPGSERIGVSASDPVGTQEVSPGHSLDATQVRGVVDQYLAALATEVKSQPLPPGTPSGVARAARETVESNEAGGPPIFDLRFQGWRIVGHQAYVTLGGTVSFGTDSFSNSTQRVELVPAGTVWDMGEIREAGDANSESSPAVAPWLAAGYVSAATLLILVVTLLCLVVRLLRGSGQRRWIGMVQTGVAVVVAVVGTVMMLLWPLGDMTVQAVEGLTGANAYSWPVPEPSTGWAFAHGEGDMYGAGVLLEGLHQFWRAALWLSGALVLALFPLGWRTRQLRTGDRAASS